MSRLAATFSRLRARGERAFVPFVTFGDPNAETTLRLARAYIEAGADILEIGIPFTDPLADGPTIQRASERALAAGATMSGAFELISEIRSVRSEVGAPPAAQLPLALVRPNASIARVAAAWTDTIKRLARVTSLEFADVQPPGSIPIVVRDVVAALSLAGVIDISAERARLDKDIERERKEVAKVDAKLANSDFMARAPEEVIAENRERRDGALSRIAKLETAKGRLNHM